MKEVTIRKKFKEICKENNWACWLPARVKFYENDIFGCFDAICSTPKGLLLVQLTTLSNVSARKKKIRRVGKDINLTCYGEVWGWDSKKKEFRIIPIYL